MSELPTGGAAPEWDLPDRLRKALRHADVSVQAMADYLGVHRNTISSYLNDRTAVDRRTLRLWAMRTGVPFGWLEEGGEQSAPPTPPPGLPSRDGGLAALTNRKRARGRGTQGDGPTHQ